MRSAGGLLLAVALLVFILPAASQSPDTPAPAWKEGYISLNEGWRMTRGDNPAFAQSGFDDSAWPGVLLGRDPDGIAPGWRWYRLRLHATQPPRPQELLLFAPDGLYEVYVNGLRADGPALKPDWRIAARTERSIPVEAAGGETTIAVRTYLPPHSLGTLSGNIVSGGRLLITASLGSPKGVSALADSYRFSAIRWGTAGPNIAFNALLLLGALGILMLYLSQRDHREYLWLGLYLAGTAVTSGAAILSITALFPISAYVAGSISFYLCAILQVEFTYSFVGHRLNRWWRMYEAAVLAWCISPLFSWRGELGPALQNAVEIPLILLPAIALPILLLVWSRQGNREAGWLILPSLLPFGIEAMADVAPVADAMGWKWGSQLHLFNRFYQVGPFWYFPYDFANLLYLLAIGIVMLFRFTRISQEQARNAAELAAGRAVQQVLIPSSTPAVPGFEIEAVYTPHGEVGGDFFQVIPLDGGGALIVIGDVSGKGMQAAMMVSLLVGALHTLAETTHSPAALMTGLNRRAMGHSRGGFTTCLILHVDANGTLTAANAGHIAPYLNGAELPVENGLPLGLFAEAPYTESASALHPGDRLTLMTDGVIEARDKSGTLLGFEKTAQLSTEPAEKVAQAAQDFGQEDDITVLTVQRLAATV